MADAMLERVCFGVCNNQSTERLHFARTRPMSSRGAREYLKVVRILANVFDFCSYQQAENKTATHLLGFVASQLVLECRGTLSVVRIR